MNKRFFGVLSAMCAAVLLASCGGQSASSGADSSASSNWSLADSSSGSASDSASSTSSGATQSNVTVSSGVQTIVNSNGTFFSTDVWQAVPMVSQSMVNSGYTGGEGCQWTNWVVFDPIDGTHAFMGNDVGGVYRSSDSGVTWEPSTLGLNTNGAVCIAFDPKNKNRVALVSTSGSVNRGTCGVFMSTDCGDTWSQSYNYSCTVNHDYRSQIVFDESSYDRSFGGCKTMYWLHRTDGLFKSTDGGKNWKNVSTYELIKGGWLEIDSKGNLYVACKSGIYKSSNGGAGWTQVFTTATNCLCIIRTAGYEKYVYAMTNSGLYVSKDSGGNFSKVTTKMPIGSVKNYTYLEVSPANPNRMVLQNDTLSKNGMGTVPCYYSTDGGNTWNLSETDKTTNVWCPYHPRQRIFSFHPTNENIVLTLGGDSIYRSTDGGKTWNYIEWTGSGSGFTYGAYALSKDVIVTGHSTAWEANSAAVKSIYVTYNGGKTITKTNYTITGSSVACGVKGNNNIVMIGEWRSTDGAKTWKKMDGCTGAFTCDPVTGWLFGVNGSDIVMSKDNGASWTTLYKQARGNVSDVAYNSKTGKVYFTLWANSIYYLQLDSARAGVSGSIEKMKGLSNPTGVAVDPSNPDIMYVVCYTNTNYNIQNAWRSLDGGNTWTGIGRQVGDGRTGPDGANQARGCTVNAKTHELIVFTHCSGVWKISGPPEKYYK